MVCQSGNNVEWNLFRPMHYPISVFVRGLLSDDVLNIFAANFFFFFTYSVFSNSYKPWVFALTSKRANLKLLRCTHAVVEYSLC